MNTLLDKNLSIEVIRTKRKKTASINISNGSVQVIVPDKISDFKVKELIKKRTSWIRKKLEEESKIIISSPKEYISGESFTYLGRNYRLKVFKGNKPEVKLIGGYLEVSYLKKSKKTTIKDILIDWYKDHAIKRLTEKTNRYAKIIGVVPNSISIRDYKSRWGSCSSKGEISYNWKIIIAHHHIVDYIVIHELCHLKHPNHSSLYWKSVKHIMPDYQVCREWLKFHRNELLV